MAAYEAARTVEVHAPERECFAALTDFEWLPEWQSRLKDVRVLTRDDRHRGHDVEYVLDATVRTVRYVLRHDYDEPHRIGSTYLEGDFRSFEGAWTFAGDDASTEVGLRLRIDPGLRLPGFAVKLI